MPPGRDGRGGTAKRPRTAAARKPGRRPRAGDPDAAHRADRILEIATRRFAEAGLEGVRLHEIARDAGLNQATLLYYFPSKRALYQACLVRAANRLAESFAEGLQAPDGRQAAVNVVTALLDRFGREPELGRLIRQASLAGGAEFEQAVITPLRPWYRRGVGALERAMDEGLIARQDAEELVLLLYGAILIYLSEDPLVVGLTGKDPRSPQNLKRHQRFVMELAARVLAPHGGQAS